ncbi:T9SS type A sorting domain-containing protein [Altibacter sp. HG106]|uniref:T9SS type A sorting domain-containing protein n=1 Tax=Altibacter sp. HG106 TaxID=3023937 RepID=UPI002350AFA4|nr:T9SS type A sorting domain-containing protein [Altibacter sp. HG106]MDC7995282.1 T9SS type A sorting domain-containing protein [Altibacter sp. HG106]
MLGCQCSLIAQYTAIPDPNFEQFLIDASHDSEGVLDGQILTADAQMVDRVDPNGTGHNIADLSGIEDFIALEYLGIGNFRGSSIDLGAKPDLVFVQFLDSPFLESLDITQCPNITNLFLPRCAFSELDISNNVELRNLTLSDNPISALDLTGNTQLEWLECSTTLVDSLNLSNAIQLVRLRAQNANLSFLDMRNGNNENVTVYDTRGNPELRCVFVDDPTYSTANWTDVDPATTFVATEAECKDLAVNDNTRQNLQLFPNPANSYFSVIGEAAIETITVYDLNGTVVKTFQERASSYDITSLSSGIYFVQMHTAKATQITKLMVR